MNEVRPWSGSVVMMNGVRHHGGMAGLRAVVLRSTLPEELVQRLQCSISAIVNIDCSARSALDLQLISDLLQSSLDLGGPFFCSGDDCFTFFT